jgi:hypothetical protein
MIIKPTVGRMVWYRPSQYDVEECRAVQHDTEQPCHAMVAYVWNDRLVNLVVYDHDGVYFTRSSVRLLQDDDVLPDNSGYAEWMPYQKGQAAKAEALEQELKTKAVETCLT